MTQEESVQGPEEALSTVWEGERRLHTYSARPWRADRQRRAFPGPTASPGRVSDEDASPPVCPRCSAERETACKLSNGQHQPDSPSRVPCSNHTPRRSPKSVTALIMATPPRCQLVAVVLAVQLSLSDWCPVLRVPGLDYCSPGLPSFLSPFSS